MIDHCDPYILDEQVRFYINWRIRDKPADAPLLGTVVDAALFVAGMPTFVPSPPGS